MIDKATKSKSLQPGILSSIVAGFDLVANHLYLIILPILLDFFLWFGPKIRMYRLIREVVEEFATITGFQPDLSDMVDAAQTMWLAFGERLNLFVLLRTFPIGVPSLAASLMPVEKPFGTMQSVEIASWIELLGIFLIISLVGIILGFIYWNMISNKVTNRVYEVRVFFIKFANVVGILVLYFIVMLLIGFPVIWVASLGLIVFPALGQLVSILIAGTLLWALIPLFFTMHGVFIRNFSIIKSIREGIRLVTRNFLPTMVFVGTIFLLSQIFDAIWRIPPEDSWLFIIGIAGHAFTATSILTATFIYYRDGVSWMETIDQEQLASDKLGDQE